MDKDLKYSRSLKGLVSIIYKIQLLSSKRRKHPEPIYSRDSFILWCMENSKFLKLYKDWEDSGFDPKKKPSIDRKIDALPYSFDNIDCCTWDENRTKGNKANAIVTSKKVTAYLQNEAVGTYNSISEASTELHIERVNIRAVCNGKRKTAGGLTFSLD